MIDRLPTDYEAEIPGAIIEAEIGQIEIPEDTRDYAYITPNGGAERDNYEINYETDYEIGGE